jgi:hypothetical protein
MFIEKSSASFHTGNFSLKLCNSDKEISAVAVPSSYGFTLQRIFPTGSIITDSPA